MQFSSPLVEGRLITRYKRFLSDIQLADGSTVTAHCANPGAMLGLVTPGNRVWLSLSANPARKLPYSWEMVEANFGAGAQLVGINTSLPNSLAAEAIIAGLIPTLAGYARLRREVKYGRASRIDILLDDDDRPPCYVEVKNVHMMRQPPLAEFPDCVTARGTKHLHELGDMAEDGYRAVMLFLIQMQAERFTLARDIDPTYAAAFDRALQRGVEAYAVTCHLTPQMIMVDRLVPIID
ncbi:DNA/RNA nuclease SfsA [Chelatococcus asaccharovorans]|uniref:Sugar fermentation stimulation protein homolog n=1 Tax=Chelatococcus asaccharovorans TaxID=28210 RepID=A0A2V3TWZ7_9HYPH|nr:DNA/RNA nuclease SfsA [Chelatococcus asaccharovorans]MBS7704128.1 DNA/RNA nuclease SfsA [Chelatococcus asaccharovorans]PXW53245.1 sugar fermentation stimulation protein [Chelatococcus asaccharovorans]